MPAEIKNRNVMVGHIRTVMKRNFKGKSIDVLLSRPLEAAALGLAVQVKAGLISKTTADKIARDIEAIQKLYPSQVEQINEACRAALSSRKRGDLKKESV